MVKKLKFSKDMGKHFEMYRDIFWETIDMKDEDITRR